MPKAQAFLATNRSESLFKSDLREQFDTLKDRIEGKRILAIGAAGSIGSATVRVISRFRPAALHVVDQNENELAELVRNFRSGAENFDVQEFRTLPLDYGSPVMRLLLQSEKQYDAILNFAAIKHVRSEKDPFSLLQMMDTNIRKQALLLKWLEETGHRGRYFSVSTDKAANPSSFMGASKRIMEHVMFDKEIASLPETTKTSARFANVAFSNGSLLQSFERRIEHGQPLAVPKDTLRFFVSMEESGELCTLASLCGNASEIMIPNLLPQDNLVLLEDVAVRFLASNGLQPEFLIDEEEARSSVRALRKKGRWPLLVTKLDTAGEKPYEEFVAQNEIAKKTIFHELLCIPHVQAPADTVKKLVDEVSQIFAMASSFPPGEAIKTNALKELIAQVEPEFKHSHNSSEKSLDLRV